MGKYDDYYLGICVAVRARAKCKGSRVGAILVKDDRVVASGFNGTPSGMPNCTDGGCERCNDPESYPHGEGYDKCICVHAEANTLLMAAKHGVSVDGATCYTTNQPCFGCLKELRQAGIVRVAYIHPWWKADESEMYQKLAQGIEMVRVLVDYG